MLGVQDGFGVIMVKQKDGRWSLPVLINVGEASLGLQLGAKSVESVYVITDEETPRKLFTNRVNIGVGGFGGHIVAARGTRRLERAGARRFVRD